MDKIPFLNKDRFVLNIGDGGAILSYFKRGNLVTRLYAASPKADGILEFKQYLSKTPKTPIIILTDTTDQTYVQQTLPGVGALAVTKLVESRIKRDFSETDLTGAIQLGRSEKGRKDWHYLFIAAPNQPPLSDWLTFIDSVPNPVAGLYLLPVESASIIGTLQKKLASSHKTKVSKWVMFISHNKVGGFRLLVTKDGKLIFTRMLAEAQDAVAAITAGNIEQEIQNTSEYLRRLSLQADDTVDVIITLAEDIKKRIEPQKIVATHVYLLTPYELAVLLDQKTAARTGDRFADTILAALFLQHKPTLLFRTKTLQKQRNYQYLQYAFWIPGAVLSLVFVLLTLYHGIRIIQFNSEIAESEATKQQVTTELTTKTAELSEGKTIEEINKINSIVKLYKVLSGTEHSPIAFFSNFHEIQENNISVENIAWVYDPPEALNVNAAPTDAAGMGESAPMTPSSPDAAPTTPDAGVIPTGGTIRATVSVFFYNTQQTIDSLFESFEQFTQRLEGQFGDYTVTYTKLPSRISFDERDKPFPIQITIEGPRPKEQTATMEAPQ